MTQALADELRKATGLEGEAMDERINFFDTEAGLALAKWCATFLRRIGEGENHYLGAWLVHSVVRMEFELARRGLLNED